MVTSACKNPDISNPTVFASGANSREWDTARPGRPLLARPVIRVQGFVYKVWFKVGIFSGGHLRYRSKRK